MKLHTLLSAAVLCTAALFSSCKNDPAASKDAAAAETATATPTLDPGAAAVADPSGIAPLPTGTVPAPDPAAKTEPPQNAAGVWHYTCPKGCAGGGGAATACAKCGTTLTHNSAYHGTPNTAATPPPSGDKSAPAKQPEPAQNKAGVWHYTCADGCAGGSGSASPCGKCGKTLVHNSAYHQ